MMYLLPSVHFDKRVAYYVKGVQSEIQCHFVQYTTEPYLTFWIVLFNPIHYPTHIIPKNQNDNI